MVWDSTAPYGGFSTVKPWLPIKEPQRNQALDRQTGEGSVLAHYRRMLKLRGAEQALRSGHTIYFDTEEPILAFSRGDAFVCVFNVSPEPARFESDVIGDPVLAEDAVLSAGAVELGPNGFMIAKRK